MGGAAHCSERLVVSPDPRTDLEPAATDGHTRHEGEDPSPPTGMAPVDRQAAFAAGAPKFPRRVLYWAIAAALVLVVGGTIADRVITSAVTKSVPPTGTGSPTGTGPALPSHAPSGATQLHAPLSAFMGLSTLKGHRAPPFSLTDAATGSTVSLASLRGHIVVLTFANAACNDICPVLASELSQAAALVGTTPVPVTFVTVNSDPLDLGHGTEPPILTQTSLASLPNWRFLTGSLRVLNSAWVAYGISITADKSTGVASHNNLMYFIKPNGSLAWSAIPFADESRTGTFSLAAADVSRFAQGIVRYADKLAGMS
jgi:cytochrome oxidase Cu insertion factor (SCO1/SenC/PrrC family)